MASHSAGSQLPSGSRLLDRLAHEALITPEAHQKAFLQAQRVGGHCCDAVIEIGAMSEVDLLKYLAKIYRTRFVTTAKLAKAKIGRKLTDRVSRKVVDRLQVCPILYDVRSQTLSVVAADLSADDIEKQLSMVSSARTVHVYVARPAAVAALIRKHYDHDPYAFSEVTLSAPQVPEPGAHGGAGGGEYYDDDVGVADLATVSELETLGASEHDVAPAAEQQPARGPIKIEAPDVMKATASAQRAARGPRRPVSISFRVPDLTHDASQVAEAGDQIPAGDYLEMMNVLVALLEQGRGELRGHSAHVVRMCRKLGERMGLTDKQLHGVLVAACLHDIGKASTYHLTALNVSQYEGHRIQAQKTFLAPVRMFESAALPQTAVETLTHIYERFDGRGFPDKSKGKEIPLGARILAIVETYCDLTTHAKNPYRKILGPRESCDAISRYGDQFFDPTLIEVFQTVVLGDDLKAKLLSDRSTVLIVDPDPEETTVLELRLVERGYEVVIARSADGAVAKVRDGRVDIVVTEVQLPRGDGFDLLERLRAELGCSDLPVLFLTRRGDSASVDRGFELGAADYLVKPASADVVAAKARQVLDRRQSGTRGVSGSLTEMSLPDVVQVLSNGRKSGVLQIKSAGVGGAISFQDGAIWHASFGDLAGEDAFYGMLLLVDGSFSLDPEGRASERTIDMSTEGLLLEGMRRLDERRR